MQTYAIMNYQQSKTQDKVLLKDGILFYFYIFRYLQGFVWFNNEEGQTFIGANQLKTKKAEKYILKPKLSDR